MLLGNVFETGEFPSGEEECDSMCKIERCGLGTAERMGIGVWGRGGGGGELQQIGEEMDNGVPIELGKKLPRSSRYISISWSSLSSISST